MKFDSHFGAISEALTLRSSRDSTTGLVSTQAVSERTALRRVASPRLAYRLSLIMLGLAAPVGLATLADPVLAQNTGANTSPSTGPAMGATALAGTGEVQPITVPAINLLIVPLDNLNLTPRQSALPIPAQAETTVAPALITPPAIIPSAPLRTAPAIVPITPASGTAGTNILPRVASQVETRVLAQKRAKEDIDDKFRMEPEFGGAYPANKRVVPMPAPGVTPNDNAFVPGAETTAPIGNSTPFLTGSSDNESGPAANAAAPLRRALVRNGFLDVLASGLDSVVVRRVINERRLSQQAIDTVRDGMAQETANTLKGTAETNTGDSAHRNALISATSRLGMSLGYRGVLLLTVVPSTNAPSSTAVAPPLTGTTTGATAVGAITSGGATSAASANEVNSTYAIMLIDTFRETGEFLVFDESGPSLLDAHEAAASTASALLARKLSLWPELTPTDRATRASEFLQRARHAIDEKRNEEATEYLNQALAYNPAQNEAQVLLGDILQQTDPVAAAQAYRRALDVSAGTGNIGQTWEKLAGAYASARDWPRTLDAGRRALALSRDTAAVHQAMATAQFGRAELFRRADQIERGEEAEREARLHLDKARELSPDDPAIIRLLAEQLVGQKRYREAVDVLDRLMQQVPPDAALLTLYATALTDRGMRDSDAFIAWARVWKMNGTQSAPMNAMRYRRIAEGFDKYVSDGATMAAQLTTGVSAGTLPRESALLQLQKILEDMQTSEAAIRILQPPAGAQNEANQASRVFAGTAIVQAVNQHRVYVETGDELYRSRANELHRQAIMQLNVARGAR